MLHKTPLCWQSPPQHCLPSPPTLPSRPPAHHHISLNINKKLVRHRQNMVSLYLTFSTASLKRRDYETLSSDEERRPMELRLSLLPMIASFLVGSACVVFLNLGQHFAANPKILEALLVSLLPLTTFLLPFLHCDQPLRIKKFDCCVRACAETRGGRDANDAAGLRGNVFNLNPKTQRKWYP